MNAADLLTRVAFDVMEATSQVGGVASAEMARKLEEDFRARAVAVGADPARAADFAARFATAATRFAASCNEATGASEDMLVILQELRSLAAEIVSDNERKRHG